MITRFACSGFKTFDQFSVDLYPFTLIVGPNASGKSNLFDAIQLLSHLATNDLRTALQQSRGQPLDLFRIVDETGKRADRMRFDVDVLLEPTVRDPWGGEKELKHTRIRYSVTLALRQDDHGNERVLVVEEHASPIRATTDRWTKTVMGDAARPIRNLFRYHHRDSAFLTSSKPDEGPLVFRIHQDGQPGRKREVVAAEATVLSTMTSADFPHLFALREEMKRWRLLHLDALALRKTSPFLSVDELQPDGSNLAATLYRIASETRSETRPKGVLPDIVRDVARCVPEVLDLVVEKVDAAREYRVALALRGGVIPAAVASDGTLRVLALCTLLQDPRHRGVLCFEEPENGVHPGRLRALIGMLWERVTDFADLDDAPLTQLLINSHSPVVLSTAMNLLQGTPGHLGVGRSGVHIVFADLVDVLDGATGTRSRKSRIRRVVAGDQGRIIDEGQADAGKVSHVEVERFLKSAQGSA